MRVSRPSLKFPCLGLPGQAFPVTEDCRRKHPIAPTKSHDAFDF